jgi:RHS repeat-associated protein
MMRRQRSIVVFLLVMLSSAGHSFAQSVYDPPPTAARKTPTPIPAAIGGVQHTQTLGFGDNGESGTYTYDGSGNITAIGSDTFLYDAEGRLKTAVIRAVPGSYTYDAFGNRKTATGETNCFGQTVCATPLTVGSSTNRLLTTTANGAATNVGYDAAGNITSASGGSYTYDGTGMMTEASVGSDDRQFVYTADDERIAVRQGASWTWTVRGLDNKVLREFTSVEPNGNSAGFPTPGGTWIKDYIWRDGLLLASVATSASGNVTWHYHLDHLGTPRLITNASGVKVAEHAYYPFGAEISLTPHESSEEAMKFTGHERDGVAGDGHSLDDMHARYYNASLGRFLEVDPITDQKRASMTPQGWNRYAFNVDNPIRFLDPTGKSYLQFDGATHTIRLFSNSGTLIGIWDASNHPQNSASADPLAKGSYAVDKNDRSAPANHSGSHYLKTLDSSAGTMVNVTDASGQKVKVADDSRQGMFGTSGIIHIDVPGHRGIGVHSGREGVTDGYGNSDWAYATNGCIRTTDGAMKVISATMKSDPLTRVDVTSDDDRHWQP